MNASHKQAARWAGPLSLAVGVFILLVACGVIPAPEEDFHSPRWVLGVVAVIFSAAGISLIFPEEPRWLRLLVVALIPLGLGITGAWAALFSDATGFVVEGGLPFVSRETNIKIARSMFGIGAVICFLATALVLKGQGNMVGDTKTPEAPTDDSFRDA